jgi:hypothetical protein
VRSEPKGVPRRNTASRRRPFCFLALSLLMGSAQAWYFLVNLNF